MTKEEIIKEAAKKYATHPTDTDNTDFYGNYEKEMRYNHDEYLAFVEGARLSDSISPWISVKEDLPCNHEELLDPSCEYNETVIVLTVCGNGYYLNWMKLDRNGEWVWHSVKNVTHWMKLPELPKE